VYTDIAIAALAGGRWKDRGSMYAEMITCINHTYDYLAALDELNPDRPWLASSYRLSLGSIISDYEAGSKPEHAVWFALGHVQGEVGELIIDATT
jgi:hypothetical protein